MTTPQPGDGQPAAPAPPSSPSIFVGFGTLEGFVAALDPARPVLALPLVEPGPTSGGISTETLLVVCQQVCPAEGTVLYCRLRAASLTRCYGEPFDPDWQERHAAWQSLWHIVRAYLTGDLGCTLQRATVAHPKNYVFLDGQAGFIHFDKDTKRYCRRPSEVPTELPTLAAAAAA